MDKRFCPSYFGSWYIKPSFLLVWSLYSNSIVDMRHLTTTPCGTATALLKAHISSHSTAHSKLHWKPNAENMLGVPRLLTINSDLKMSSCSNCVLHFVKSSRLYLYSKFMDSKHNMQTVWNKAWNLSSTSASLSIQSNHTSMLISAFSSQQLVGALT